MSEQNMHVMCDRDIVRLGTENDALRKALAVPDSAVVIDLSTWTRLADLDRWARTVGVDRANAIRMLVNAGLSHV